MNFTDIDILLTTGESQTVEIKGFRVTVSLATQKIATREQIVELLQVNPRMTKLDLASQLSKSENTIKEHLAKLKAEGRLKRVGSDRSGYWVVISYEK